MVEAPISITLSNFAYFEVESTYEIILNTLAIEKLLIKKIEYVWVCYEFMKFKYIVYPKLGFAFI